jgi:hypothetical protein
MNQSGPSIDRAARKDRVGHGLSRAWIGLAVMAVAGFGSGIWAAPQAPGKPFVDAFDRTDIGDAWTVHEGKWAIESGTLTCRDGGVISLSAPPGGRYEMEFEIAFPGSWMSVIPYFTAARDYGTLYFGAGYWESFEMSGDNLGNYVQRKDAEIQRPGGFQKISVVAEYGVVSFTYDGKPKGPAQLAYRPGSRIAFRSLPGSGSLKIRNFKVRALPADDRQAVRVDGKSLVKATMHADDDREESSEKPRARIDAAGGGLTFDYAFGPGRAVETAFARIPVAKLPPGRLLVMDVEGDSSANGFFVIVHDASGEQHLVLNSPLAWSGWQDVAANLEPFLKPPPDMERSAKHWGGDGNQVIDFPITAIDVGVAKRDGRSGSGNKLRLKNLRFLQ